MAYDINIIGNSDPLRVEYGVGTLIERWKLFKLKKISDEPVEIGEWVGALSAIKSFRPIEANRSNTNASRESDNEYRRDLAAIRALTPAEKAKRMGLFRLVYWGFTRKRSENAAVEAAAEKIQRMFFDQHPKRVFCDPILFMPIIRKGPLPEKKGESLGGRIDAAVMRIITEQIQQDKFAEKLL